MTLTVDTAMLRRLTFALLLLAAPVAAQQRTADTIRAGRYDLGKMWTFEYAPADYFSQTYGFTADSAWFARARLAALRVPGCSASFVSPNGLIVTNHHCVRGSVNQISRRDEALLDSGFVARTPEEERRIPGYYADQLLAALDVTDEVEAAAAARDDAEQPRARREASQAVQARLRREYQQPGDSIWVQVVALYNGGRTSAYVFRRYTDIRLVVAVELAMGNFGGDPDNFTFPRYALDFAVLRAYGPDGRPVRSPAHFRWGSDGVREGDVVFVIGNPGQTRRLTTMSQLEFQRDVALPLADRFLGSRIGALRAYRDASGDPDVRRDLLVQILGLSNAHKPIAGRLEGLRDPVIMGRRLDIERALRDSIRARADLRQRYGRLFDRMAEYQAQRRRYATAATAFSQMTNASVGSATLQLAYWASRVQRGRADSASAFRERLGRVRAVPRELERRLLALALEDVVRAYGPGHVFSRAALGASATPEAAADALLATTALTDTAGGRRAAAGELVDDPVMRLIAAWMPTILEAEREYARIGAAEAELAADLGRARFAVFGRSVPPDGTFSPRIADGVVRGYEYNGTWAAPFTTFFGMYDRFHANGAGSDWDLPYRWRTPPAGLDLGTPLNFVSTADSYGGNSGSPAVTKDLRLVGLNFDRNINALVRDYIYLPERGRNVMVDVRAIHAALEHVYRADRIVAELVASRDAGIGNR
jgi:hypothetical protein